MGRDDKEIRGNNKESGSWESDECETNDDGKKRK